MRAALALAAALLAVPAWAVPAWADDHGLSPFGALKYPEGFAHFDWVNPDAPKGGSLRTTSVLGTQTFDSLNPYILKGDAADGLASPYNLVFDTLMARAWDEPAAVYGLVAESAEVDPGRSVTFTLRDQARFSDGSPLTAEDVAFSFDVLKEKGHPAIRIQLRDVEAVEAGEGTVTYRFREGAPTRNLPVTVATLPIFSKADWEGEDFAESSLRVPLSSGPYRIADVQRDRSITYERRDDYWAADLPVNVGRWNFDRITFEYFRDMTAAFDALTSGRLDLREEFSSKFWGTRYDFPALKDGRVVAEALPDERPAGTQGYFINTRRAKFADPRVREALDLAFDFEWSNEALFHDLYARTDSFFENSSFEAEGEPGEAEVALLEPLADDLPEGVLDGAAYVPPVTDGSGRNRRNLRAASKLLDEAGWTLVDGKRAGPDGAPLTIEFLQDDSSFSRITGPYVENLKRLGIDASIRIVDRPQYQRRQKAFDFDVIVSRFSFSQTPGRELANFFSSEAADQEGSFNLAGIREPAADALIEAITAAETREEMEAAARALDRVLRAGHYWVPQWSKGSHTLAWWDRYERPATKPKFARGVLDTWWQRPGTLTEDAASE